MPETTLGERIRAARKRAGLTQGQVAEATGSGRAGTVNGWERKDIVPEGSALMALPGVLNVDAHWLLTGDGEMDRLDPRAETAALAEIAAIIDRLRGATLPSEAAPIPEPAPDQEEQEPDEGESEAG